MLIKQLMVAIGLHSMYKLLWKSMATINPLVTNILQKNAGLEQHEG